MADPEQNSGTTDCLTNDGCPAMICECTDGLKLSVQGCIEGSCVDQPQEFCFSQCESHGGTVFSAVNLASACEGYGERTLCLACRAEAGTACMDTCGEQAAALADCLAAAEAEAGIPEGMWDTRWWRANYCTEPRDLFFGCARQCDFDKCETDNNHDTPWRPSLVTPTE